jgi:hypothetical protein
MQCKRLIDAPIAAVERVGQRGTGGRRAQPHVKELRRVGRQAGFDVAQTLAPSQLREGKDAEQLCGRQLARARIAVSPGHNAAEGLPGNKLHDLSEERLAGVHAASLEAE